MERVVCSFVSDSTVTAVVQPHHYFGMFSNDACILYGERGHNGRPIYTAPQYGTHAIWIQCNAQCTRKRMSNTFPHPLSPFSRLHSPHTSRILCEPGKERFTWRMMKEAPTSMARHDSEVTRPILADTHWWILCTLTIDIEPNDFHWIVKRNTHTADSTPAT